MEAKEVYGGLSKEARINIMRGAVEDSFGNRKQWCALFDELVEAWLKQQKENNNE